MTKSVKILCSGEDRVIDNFTHTIKIRGEESGAEIEGIKEKALPFNIDLPDDFSKVSSDDDFDLGRKLDKGNEFLKTLPEMNEKLNTLSEMNTTLKSLPEMRDMLGSSIAEQRGHNNRLEAILQKLADKA